LVAVQLKAASWPALAILITAFTVTKKERVTAEAWPSLTVSCDL
jgi:hypothetical protein